MQINFRLLFALLSFAAVSCSDAPDSDVQPGGEKISVTIGSGIGIDSRTALGDDGITVKWVKGDQISLWAVNAEAGGGAQLSAETFNMWHYNEAYGDAKFTADIPVMPKGTYNYYAVSPRPASVSGLKATYEIPDVQNGSFTGAYDIMVATPATGAELTSGDNSDKISLSFAHKVHVLKISIPQNKMGLPISKLEITFPQPVVGQLTVDASDPAAAPEFTGASNVLTLEFPEPIDVNSTVYATIAPVNFDPTENIQFKAYTETKESLPAYMPGKVFAEAHTTPIKLTIPEVYRITHVIFSVNGSGMATIGEKINSFTLTAPAGVDLGEGTNTRTFAINDDNQYYISYVGEFNDNLSGKAFTVAFDTENTLITKPFTMPSILADERNEVRFQAPWLLEENFSGVNGKGFDDTKGDGEGYGYALADMNLTGWSGQRIGSQTNTAVRINSCHYCNRLGKKSNFHGSLTSSPLSGIKPGASVKVKVTFLANGSSDNTQGYFGSTTATGNPTFNNSGQSPVAIETNNSYDNISTANEFTLTVTSAHRLSWNVSNNDSSGGFLSGVTNRHYLYIDNVKVIIVK